MKREKQNTGGQVISADILTQRTLRPQSHAEIWQKGQVPETKTSAFLGVLCALCVNGICIGSPDDKFAQPAKNFVHSSME